MGNVQKQKLQKRNRGKGKQEQEQEDTECSYRDLDFSHNLYYFDKKGYLSKYNKKSRKKSRTNYKPITKKSGYFYSINKDGNVIETKMKNN